MSRTDRSAERDYLDPLRSKVKRRQFVTYDIESKHDDTQRAGFTRPFLVGLYDPKAGRYQEFRDEAHLSARPWYRRHVDPGGCIDKFLTVFLTKKYAGSIAYAHNAGSFDALFLLTWLQEHRDEYGFEVVPVQSSIQVIRVWRVPESPDHPIRERWDFLDSMKLLPMGLEKACKAMGVAGKKLHDLDMHESDPRWSEYLEQDCRALSAVMGRFYDLVENRLGGEVGMTTPSTAVKLFRRRYIGRGHVQEQIPRYRHFPGCDKPHSCLGCLHTWIRLGYYGGRTEIHHFYGELLRYFDFNSSYAASMNADMPIGDLIVEQGKLDMRRHTSRGGRYAGFCECTVEIPEDCPIPPLPHRHRETGKLVFPAGRFHGVWSVDELALLDDPLVGGRIVHVTKTVWFGLRPMFQPMIQELYSYRDKSRADFDEGLSLLAKLLMNGGYGKFAMKQERSTCVFAFERAVHPSGSNEVGLGQCFLCRAPLALDAEGEAIGDVCEDCEGSKPASPEAEGAVWYKAQYTDAAYIIPQIAAHITATARVRLWRAMRQVVSSFAGETMRAADLRYGDVVLLGEGASGSGVAVHGDADETRPHVVVSTKRVGREIVLTIRGAGPDGAPMLLRTRAKPRAELRVGGRIYYLDTDSVITNVLLPSSTELGALKDEYDGATLSYVGLQAKAYLISRTGDMERIRALPLDGGEMPAGEVVGKVTMKGFPPSMRTPAYFAQLLGVDSTRAAFAPPPARRTSGATLAWERLDKVRTLARERFGRSPRMTAVTKSLKSDYDKRRRFGANGTRPIVLNEPIGGVAPDEDAAAE